MDKNHIETYKYLALPDDIPNNNVENDLENGQLLLVQEDGTIVINREIQFVTPVEEGKDVQECTVYDVSSQPFFVNVDNSTELITVSDQYVPSTGGNLYSNQYILQPDPIITDQIEEETQHELEQSESDTIGEIPGKNTHENEITLSEKQCEILEKLGWVLLENDGKIFALDKSGLHDITLNENLIQNLTVELSTMGYVFSVTDRGATSELTIADETNSGHKNELVNSKEDCSMEVTSADEVEKTPKTAIEENRYISSNMSTESNKEQIEPDSDNRMINVKQEPTSVNNDNKVLRFETNLVLKDIPDKIVLGRTKNGKNLVAKVIQRSHVKDKLQVNRYINKKNVVKKEIHKISKHFNKNTNLKSFTDKHHVFILEPLIQKALVKDQVLYTQSDITMARNVVTQLLSGTMFKKALMSSSHVFITKTTKDDENNEDLNDTKSSLLTGKVVVSNGSCEFIHEPDINKLLNECDIVGFKGRSIVNDELNRRIGVSYNVGNELHIHIVEIRSAHESRIAKIKIRRCRLSFLATDTKKCTQGNTKYELRFACRTCAAIFPNKEELVDHMESQCGEQNKEGIVKGKEENKSEMAVSESRLGYGFACQQCSEGFSAESHLNKHMDSHALKTDTDEEDTSEPSNPKRMKSMQCKCMICGSFFNRETTLLKHFVAKHVLKE